MSWVSPLHHANALFPGDDRVHALWITPPAPKPAPAPQRPEPREPNRGGMGSAAAAHPVVWQSPSPVPQRATGTDTLGQPRRLVGRVSVSPELWQAVAAYAAETGRTPDDVWAEAARDWLARRAHHDEPPPTSPASAALSGARHYRAWGEIDATLAELRRVPESFPAA